MIDALKSFSYNKSLGNDGFINDVYEEFWSEFKEPYMNSITQIKISKDLLLHKGKLL